MGWLTTTVRRSIWIVLIAAAGGAVWTWRRDTADASAPAPAEWPPLSTAPRTPPAATPPGQAFPPPSPTSSSPTSSSPTSSSGTTSSGTVSTNTSSASVVNALVDAPEARSADRATGGWTDPLDDGTCPITHPIKANDNSGIFHLPGGRFYKRTKAERCYSDAEAAIADGYRRSKN